MLNVTATSSISILNTAEPPQVQPNASSPSSQLNQLPRINTQVSQPTSNALSSNPASTGIYWNQQQQQQVAPSTSSTHPHHPIPSSSTSTPPPLSSTSPSSAYPPSSASSVTLPRSSTNPNFYLTHPPYYTPQHSNHSNLLSPESVTSSSARTEVPLTPYPTFHPHQSQPPQGQYYQYDPTTPVDMSTPSTFQSYPQQQQMISQSPHGPYHYPSSQQQQSQYQMMQAVPRPYPTGVYEHPQYHHPIVSPPPPSGTHYYYDQQQAYQTMPPGMGPPMVTSNGSVPLTTAAAAQFPSMVNAIAVTSTSLGQTPPPGIKPRITTTLWEDEGTLCFQVEARGISVARREDNNMINGTKLLNVAGMTRGRRDGILKSEKIRHVVKIGTMYLKGVWIPYERALEFATKEKIVDLLYPLFVADIKSFLYHPLNYTRTVQVLAAAERKKQVDQIRLQQQQQQSYYIASNPVTAAAAAASANSMVQRLQSPYMYSAGQHHIQLPPPPAVLAPQPLHHVQQQQTLNRQSPAPLPSAGTPVTAISAASKVLPGITEHTEK